MKRRTFLAAMAGGLFLGKPLQTWSKLAEEQGLNVGIQMYSLRGYKAEEAIGHAHDIGFRHLEFYSGMYPTNATPEQIKAMNQLLADKGLKLSGHGVNRFSKDHDANRRLFEFAKAAGVRNLTADTDPDSFDSLEKLVEEFNIRIAIHNHGPRHRYNKVNDVLSAVQDRHPLIGACADLGHYIRSAEEPTAVIRALDKRLFGVHLKDFAEKQDKTKGVILGKGHLDVEGVFQALKHVKFPADGALSLEYEENPKNPLDDIQQCFNVAQAALKKLS